MNQLAERNAELITKNEELQRKYDDLVITSATVISELQRKVEALAAEVQAIRWASGQVYARGYNHGHLNTVDGLPYSEEKDLVIRVGETLCEYIDPDYCGVATDAIIAEIEARGVDKFADVTIKIGTEEQAPSIIFAGKQAQLFAEQLRKESGE